MNDHDGGRAAARRARAAEIAQVTGGASIPHGAGDGMTPELTEAETLEVADAILERGETDEPINQFRERATRYAAKRDAES